MLSAEADSYPATSFGDDGDNKPEGMMCLNALLVGEQGLARGSERDAWERPDDRCGFRYCRRLHCQRFRGHHRRRWERDGHVSEMPRTADTRHSRDGGCRPSEHVAEGLCQSSEGDNVRTGAKRIELGRSLCCLRRTGQQTRRGYQGQRLERNSVDLPFLRHLNQSWTIFVRDRSVSRPPSADRADRHAATDVSRQIFSNGGHTAEQINDIG